MLERKADEVIHEVFRRLNQTFITPLDPEDIHSLSTHLDDVIDSIEEASHRMVIYNIEPITQCGDRGLPQHRCIFQESPGCL